MKQEEAEKHIIRDTETVLDALARLNTLSGGLMTLVVIDADRHVLGTVTDGDIRRALISGVALGESVLRAAFTFCTLLRPDDDPYLKVAAARDRGITLLPGIGTDGRLEKIIDLRKRQAIIPVEAVLMAGGKGERLRPMTLTRPKPLLEVGGRPIIDYNIDALRRVGIDRICVSVNYLKEQLIEHFRDPRFEGMVECVEEPCRLGTMGSLAYCAPFTKPDVLVMNSDLLTDMDFEDLFLHHKHSGADLTMAVVSYPVSIPFAIIATDGDRVTGLSEKPTFNNLANAGVYLMSRRVAESVVKGEYLDAPDLVERVIAEGGKVGWYQIKGTWIDIGSPDDFRYANDLMKLRHL